MNKILNKNHDNYKVVFMFLRRKKYNLLTKSIDKLNSILNRKNILELYELLGNRKELLKRNLLSGIFKGIGVGIGFYLLTAVLFLILQKIVKLNIPVIGQYLADLLELAQNY